MPDNIDVSFTERIAPSSHGCQNTRPTRAAEAIQDNLRKRAGAKLGSDCFISPDAQVLTEQLTLGDRS
jgi:hypothetical protein